MMSAEQGSPRPEPWRHLTKEEHHDLHALLQYRLAPRGTDMLVGEPLTFGQRLADRLTNRIGSWSFIIVQSIILLVWIVVNTIAWREHWDPYPFILLNLVLSFQAAYAAPIIKMSQNRQAAKDREKAEADYAVDSRAEWDVAAVHARLDELAGLQWATLVEMPQRQLELLTRIKALTREVHRVTILQDPARQSTRRENA